MPRPGDLILVHGRGLVARIIRQVTGGHWNHVEIYLGNGQSVGADLGEGVRTVVPAEKFADADWQFFRVVNASDEQAKRISLMGLTMVKRDYDARGLLGIWLRFALKRIGINLKGNPTESNKSWFCSELATYLYSRVDVRIGEHTPALTSPTDIGEAVNVVSLKENE